MRMLSQKSPTSCSAQSIGVNASFHNILSNEQMNRNPCGISIKHSKVFPNESEFSKAQAYIWNF